MRHSPFTCTYNCSSAPLCSRIWRNQQARCPSIGAVVDVGASSLRLGGTHATYAAATLASAACRPLFRTHFGPCATCADRGRTPPPWRNMPRPAKPIPQPWLGILRPARFLRRTVRSDRWHELAFTPSALPLSARQTNNTALHTKWQ